MNMSAIVQVNGRLSMDGGLFDDAGLVGLPGIPSSNLIVNFVCGRSRIHSSKIPEKFPDARVSCFA